MIESHSHIAAIAEAVAAWSEKGRVGDLLPHVFQWYLQATQADRAAAFVVTSSGGYRVRSTRNHEGQSVSDVERWVSHFAVQRALEGGRMTSFADTRSDRRFRTESEIEQGVRTRSILVVPITHDDAPLVLYFDSRLRPMELPDDLPQVTDLWRGLLRQAIAQEGTAQQLRSVERRLAQLEATPATPTPPPTPAPSPPRPKRDPISFHEFVTQSPPLIATIEEAQRLATSRLAVLIEGASGTGKEVLARAIHAASGREGPFVSIHCGSIPRTLVEIELFGHAKGAFTGAENERSGLIEVARGGTVFLDDVGEMPAEMQTALLRVLQTGVYRRVSDDVERDADIRVISATQVGESAGGTIGELRTDLYYRLAGVTLQIPPLSERPEDVPLLVQHFFERYHEGDDPPSLDAEVRERLLTYGWPGNVRELENQVRRSLALGDASLGIHRLAEANGSIDAEVGDDSPKIQTVIDSAERQAIVQALDQAGGNKSQAAKILGLSRKTLYRRLQKHGIPL